MTSGRFWAQPPGCSADSSAPPNATHRDVVPGWNAHEIDWGDSVNFRFSLQFGTVDLGLYYSFGTFPPLQRARQLFPVRKYGCLPDWSFPRLPFQDISTSHEYTQMYQQTCSWRLDGLCINTQGIKPWILFFFCALSKTWSTGRFIQFLV